MTQAIAPSARRKVKVIRQEGGRYNFEIVCGGIVIYLSPTHYPSVGDAKSAGKAFMRRLPDTWIKAETA